MFNSFFSPQTQRRVVITALKSMLPMLVLVAPLSVEAKSSTVYCSHSASRLLDTQKLLAENPTLISKSDKLIKDGNSSEKSESAQSDKSEKSEKAANESASTKPLLTKPASIAITGDGMAKLAKVSVTVDEHGKTVKYTGTPLRLLLKTEIVAIDDMPAWKQLARQKIMLEVLGKDGFPALMSAVEVATNQSGDRFVLATEEDGKQLEEVRLICPNDQHRTRWVRDCASLKIFRLDQ